MMERLRALALRLARLAREGVREADGQRLTGTLLRDDLRGAAHGPGQRGPRAPAPDRPGAVRAHRQGGRTSSSRARRCALDRRVVDELRDPLLHLVRNAVDHGIEAADERRRAGKSARGQVWSGWSCAARGWAWWSRTTARAGRQAAVRAAAVRRGVIRRGGGGASLPEARTRPSSSSSRAFHRLRRSPRSPAAGVGLDVVQDTAHRLQGTVGVAYELGQWTRFDLEVPVSLSASAALLVRIGRGTWRRCPPTPSPGCSSCARATWARWPGRATVRVGGTQLPYATALHAARAGGARGPGGARRFQPALVVAVGGQRVVVGVEEVLGQQELVVSRLGARLARVPHLAGAAVLDDGRVVGVLAAGELLRRVQPAGGSPRAAAPARPGCWWRTTRSPPARP